VEEGELMANINLGPKESKEDAAGLAKEAERKAERDATKQEMKILKEKLAKLDAQERSGVAPLTPKSDLFDARELAEANPDKHYRWLSTRNEERMPHRKHKEGYKPVSEADAKAHNVYGDGKIGPMVLAEQPREVYERRIESQKQENERRLTAHKTSMERVVESIARELRDKHGIRVKEGQLLVDE
jgi:hypothetical protein